MKASDYIVQVLKKYNVKYVFGYQGANISHVIDSIGNESGIEFVETYNEQGASFAANGYSLATQGLGVAIASSGPGAINLLNGIANAYFDSLPCLFITGNVGLGGFRPNERIRQNSFQELDIVSLTQNITKYSYCVKDASEIPYQLEKAIRIAFDGRPGAVHIDLPHNIQKADIEIHCLKEFPLEKSHYDHMKNFINKYLEVLKKAKKPLILIGGGASFTIKKEEMMSFLDKLDIPFVCSLNGISAVNQSSKNYFGFIGDYGNRYANIALENCDCLLIMGSRLDGRQTGADLSAFASHATIFRIDIDDVELERVSLAHYHIQSDLKSFINCFEMNSNQNNDCHNWKKMLNKYVKLYPSYDSNREDVHVNTFLHYISHSQLCNKPYIVCGDVGNHQMAIAQSFFINENGYLFNSGGLGSMGFALPAIIGCYYGNKNSNCIAICGDGGFQMNIQELQLIAREHLPIKIIIINNSCLGMIRGYQKLVLDSRFYGSVEGFTNPDYCQISHAFGLEYVKIENVDDYNLAVDMLQSNKACIIEVVSQYDIELMPEMGLSINKQRPLLSEEDYEEIRRDFSNEKN